MSDEATKWCADCRVEQKKFTTKYCEVCGGSDFYTTSSTGELLSGDKPAATKIQDFKDDAIENIFTTTLPSLPGREIAEDFGLVFGTSSKMALGLNKQSTRIELALDAAIKDMKVRAKLKGADAVLGVQFALNNSQGSLATAGGSSEGVCVMGSAVKLSK